ncbi:unnamed protein product, partial [Prorocentrum cordatum]
AEAQRSPAGERGDMGSGCGRLLAHHPKAVIYPIGDCDEPVQHGLYRSEAGRASVRSESSSRCSTTTSPRSRCHEQAPGYSDILAPGSPRKAADGLLFPILTAEGTATSCTCRHSTRSTDAGTDRSASPTSDVNSPKKGVNDRCLCGRFRSKEAPEGCKPKGGRNATKDRHPHLTCTGHAGARGGEPRPPEAPQPLLFAVGLQSRARRPARPLCERRRVRLARGDGRLPG